MAINITNLVSAINAKSATIGTGVDSALDKAVLLASDVKNALIYSSVDNLPDPSTSSSGEIVRVGSQTDANTKYYVSFRDKWKQIGVSDSDVVTTNQFVPFQGTNFGYASGSYGPTGSIDKFPFASDGNATAVGDLSVARGLSSGTGQSSTVSGYTCGGIWVFNVIDKFPFAADGNATDVGDLSTMRGGNAGHSSGTVGYGYVSGGVFIPNNQVFNIIEKFPFSADANATDVGDLTVPRYRLAGQSSNVSGYSSGGERANPNAVYNTIDKFPFSSDTNATDVADLATARSYNAGQSSQENGYLTAGTIQKFSFASDTNATTTGNVTIDYGLIHSGQSSTSNGYASGGPIIDKFSFATDGNATDVGDLVFSRYEVAGQQF